jgi:hypothetical protein
MHIKLVRLEVGVKIALVECECGGRTFIPTAGATKTTPVRRRCPICRSVFDYPTDLEK